MPESCVTIEQAILFIERATENAGLELDIDLRSLYDESELSDYATREEVSELLYYALTGNTDGFDGEYSSSNGWNNGNHNGQTNGSSSMTVTYSLDDDETVTFDDSDFIDAFSGVTDEDLSYIKFTSLPSSSAGVLYYDYDEDDSSHTKITTNTTYDVGDVSDITFVPASTYSGTVSISFTGYDEDDESYSGRVKITVSDSDISEVADTFTITTDNNEPVTLDDSDFIDAFSGATDEDLSYIKFTSLPSSSAGVLYYDYDEDDSSHTKITTNTTYDVGDVSDITFVPASTYSGTVTVSYTGYTEDDTAYTGSFKIVVEESEEVAETIYYYADENESVAFTLSDFKSVCSDLTGKTLSGVNFTLPGSSTGVLYYNYRSDDDTPTTVASYKTYYVGSLPYLSKVTFVPEDDYSGTVEISYTGYTVSDTTFTGTIIIEIG
ncbi:MAG TPA: hypothetical protein PK597_05110 [Oscillospiraceae bacterium]|nr:hypothetical protein [Oscillospiraceae bacterium]